MNGVNNLGSITTNGGDVVGRDKIIYGLNAPSFTQLVRIRVAEFSQSSEFVEMQNIPDTPRTDPANRYLPLAVATAVLGSSFYFWRSPSLPTVWWWVGFLFFGFWLAWGLSCLLWGAILQVRSFPHVSTRVLSGGISPAALLISALYFTKGPVFRGVWWWMGLLFFGFWLVLALAALSLTIACGVPKLIRYLDKAVPPRTPAARKAIGIVEKTYIDSSQRYFDVLCIFESNDKKVFRVATDHGRQLSVGDVGVVAINDDDLSSFLRSNQFSI